jgi:hypothetical protein
MSHSALRLVSLVAITLFVQAGVEIVLTLRLRRAEVAGAPGASFWVLAKASIDEYVLAFGAMAVVGSVAPLRFGRVPRCCGCLSFRPTYLPDFGLLPALSLFV